MARSILPSSSGHGARKALQSLRRADRRGVSQALQPLRGSRGPAGSPVVEPTRLLCPCLAPASGSLMKGASCPLCELRLPDYPLGEHCHEIWLRRAYDKVAPLISWARHEVDGMAAGEARVHLGSILPPGVIGQHAMSHLVWPLDLDETPHERVSESAPRVDARRALRSIGRWALEHGHHRQLNALVHRHLGEAQPVVDAAGRHRRRPRTGSSWNRSRPLLGAHDLEGWAAALAPEPRTEHLGEGSVLRGTRRWPRALVPIAAWASSQGWHDPSVG